MQNQTLETNLDAAFNTLVWTIPKTLVAPGDRAELEALYNKAIPTKFTEAAHLLMADYGIGTSPFTQLNCQMMFLLPEPKLMPSGAVASGCKVTISIAQDVRKNPRPGVPVFIPESLHAESGPWSKWAAELAELQKRATSAVSIFQRMTTAVNTSAMLFYAFPLFKEHLKQQPFWKGYNFPAGRRPRNFDPNVFPDEQVDFINETLLMARIHSSVAKNPVSSEARAEYMARQNP